MARLLVYGAGARFPDPVPRLSARPWRLAVVHRHQDRPRRRVHRPRELRVARRGFDLLGLGVQYAALHDRGERDKIRRGALSRAAPEPELAVQGDDPRRDSGPLHRADGFVSDCLLVDLRHAVLDPVVVAAQARADLDQYRLPWRSVECALVDYLRQYLARRAVCGD